MSNIKKRTITAIITCTAAIAGAAYAQDDFKVVEEVMIVGAVKSAASAQSTNTSSQENLPELPLITE